MSSEECSTRAHWMVKTVSKITDFSSLTGWRDTTWYGTLLVREWPIHESWGEVSVIVVQGVLCLRLMCDPLTLVHLLWTPLSDSCSSPMTFYSCGWSCWEGGVEVDVAHGPNQAGMLNVTAGRIKDPLNACQTKAVCPQSCFASDKEPSFRGKLGSALRLEPNI